MPQEIHVTIEPNGKVQIEVNGVKGKACRDLTAEIEKHFKVIETKDTAEATQHGTTTQHQQVRG